MTKKIDPHYTETPPPECSDGVDTKYPTNTDSEASPDNYFRLVDKTERKNLLYRLEGARAIVTEFDLITEANKKHAPFVLSDFPENYKLYEHNKKQSNGKLRTDHYLFGHPSGARFRSVPEFLPHLLHLAAMDLPAVKDTPAYHKHIICTCLYCSRGGRGGPGLASATRTPRNAGISDAERATLINQVEKEERLGEQEMNGWVLRKGELVWIWIGDKDIAELDEATAIGQHENWAAGIVIEKPSVVPSLYPPKKGDVQLDPDSDKNRYAIQLWEQDGSEGEIIKGIEQWEVRPWLSRSSAEHRNENYSVQFARELAATTSVFERIKDPHHDQNFGGLFVGPEKIFVGDPIRIHARPIDEDDTENVLVVDKIYTETNPSPLPPDPDTGLTRVTNVTIVGGSVYTHDKDRNSADLTPDEFSKLPFRMRHGCDQGNYQKWYRRSKLDECGEISTKLVLGRWYEPVAIKAWGGILESKPRLKYVCESRGDALGWNTLNDVQLVRPEDRKKAPVPEIANPTPSKPSATHGDDKMDLDDPEHHTPPKSQFMSVNGPGSASASKSKLMRAAELDDEEEENSDEEEDEEEDEEMEIVDANTFGKSPTKRFAL